MATVKPKRIRHTVQSNAKYLDALGVAQKAFPYPQPGGSTRYHYDDAPEGENTHRSLSSLYDWDAVEKANKASRKGK